MSYRSNAGYLKPAGQSPFHQTLRQAAISAMEDAMASARGNRTHAAWLLGLQRTYFLRLLRQLGIKRRMDLEYPPTHVRGWRGRA